MTQKSSKSSEKFYCSFCDYTTCRKSQYDRHLTTLKHKMITNDYKKVPEKSKYECECGKQYKYRQGLYNHKKTCNFKKENLENLKEDNLENAKKIENDDNVDYKELFLKAMEKNDELVSKIVEMAPNIGNNNNSTKFGIHKDHIAVGGAGIGAWALIGAL